MTLPLLLIVFLAMQLKHPLLFHLIDWFGAIYLIDFLFFLRLLLMFLAYQLISFFT